jgi:3-oxoacyl-[acyl-carrier protein] reductase
VVLSGTRVAALETLQAELGSRAHRAVCDLSDSASVDALPKTAEAAAGPIDILVNNAGITRDNLMMSMKRSDWDLVIAINLTGPFLLTQALLRPMIKNRWGRIINMASVVGRAGQAGQVNYAASKAGLIGLTKSLAREVASRGITVNAVAPGYIETPMTAVLDEKVSAAMLANIPLSRRGTDLDVAQAVKFLASDAASYITGHVLDVNGGMFMG